ncbi:MAG: phosphoribosylglycinamide formyltransferase [Pseudomonadota bacterium]
MTTRVAILISGLGSNMVALLDAMADAAFPAVPALVISNRADAAGLEKAQAVGVATQVIPHRGKTKPQFERELDEALRAANVGLICLAGFMRVLSADFVSAWPGKILNIHPSLLPAFRGLHVHEQALEAGVKVSGCTVHWVTAELDGGPIIGQGVVPVRDADNPATLAARVQRAEHIVYPAALARALGKEPETLETSDFLFVV